ncbi:MAG: phosphate signaling complex protein PhoU [Planctomycetota bacterium]
MSIHLRRDLDSLERRLLILVGLVEEALRSSIAAVLDRRLDLAEKVIAGDEEIDRREVELEEECLKSLALHQPVASDLRFVAACLKIDNDLERIGDLATNIAERAVALAALPPISISPRLREMMEMCVRMLRDSTAALVRGHADLARRVCAEDDTVDAANEHVVTRELELMHQDPSRIEERVNLISISKNLERVADHTTNIAEDVLYLVEGEIVRHRAPGGS